jgi:putative ABC transport system permease protein
MDYKELVLLALEALKSNVARTLLTMLGIIIGIASVITIISLGKGTTASIVDDISSFGAKVITVSPGRIQRGPGTSANTVTTLVLDDAEAIAKLSNVVAVSGVVSKSKVINANGETSTSSIKGVDVAYAQIQSISLDSGLFLDEGDVAGATRDVVLGDEIVEDLYGEDAEELVVGESIRIDGAAFRIIGVVDESSDALIPISTAQKILFGQTHLDSISVEVSDSKFVDQVMDDIESLLLIQHDIDDPSLADFSTRSTQSITETVSSVTGTLTTAISGIAAISLLVGGIGIMNIMLVTVTERTKEIGLLKAIGAKRKHILTQFLIESIILTLFGGLIGMGVGIGVSFVASSVMSIPFVVSASSVILAIGVSAAVGILFGWYPANKAAKLNPIDALRYE